MQRIIAQLKALHNSFDRLHTVLRAYVGPRKIMLICEQCGGVYRASPDGLRCANCGELIPVVWPDGTTPTAEDVRVLVRLAWDEKDDLPGAA